VRSRSRVVTASRSRKVAEGLLLGSGTANVLVRINEPAGGRWTGRPCESRGVAEALLMVPKARIETLEMAHAAGARTIALVETAAGVMEVEQIARLGAVAGIATVDLAADLGLSELPEGLELLHARSRLALVCAAAGIAGIDGVCLAVPGGAALLAEANRARALGFQAKMCIHPS
jgi:citrate lyase subunit beta / citryl-CoA lyase